MQLKGNITIEQSKPDVQVTESGKQASVTINYTLKGIDLSEGVHPTGNEDDDSEEADRVLDLAKKEIRKHFIDFYQGKFGLYAEPGTRYPKEANPIVETEEFVGVDADVHIYGGETVESLKDLQAEVNVTAFYDIPASALASAVELAMKALIGKEK